MSTVSSSRVPEQWSAFIAVAVLALLPIGRSAELPLWIGAVAGMVFVWRDRKTLSQNAGVKLAVVLFACYWLPALISAPGSVAPDKTWSTVAVLLRFLPFALFACIGLRRADIWPRIVAACAAITVLWLLDAWVQIFTGYSLAGVMSDERLSGIFGAGNLKLGPVLAVMSPFVFVAARERFGWRGLALAFVFQLMPILLAGSRSGWLMFGLVALAFAWRETKSIGRFLAFAASAVCIVAIAVAAAWHASSAFDARMQRSLLALQGSEHAVDEASAGRLRIWSTAARMFEAHPLSGVGVRGFRYAYPSFAEPGDAFVDTVSDEGASHAHQIVLEIASETGVPGLILWIAGAALALRAWIRASTRARTRAFAPALALAVMCFPLNTHLAFYSAWWGMLFWWLLSLYCAALSAEPTDVA
jgi:O-antigen ligase